MIGMQQLNNTGSLTVDVFRQDNNSPVPDAAVTISFTGEPESVLETVYTNSGGWVQVDGLLAPPVEYSLEPGNIQPYAQYSISVTSPGYRRVEVAGIEVFPGQMAIQEVALEPVTTEEYGTVDIVVPANTLLGGSPSKIPEAEIKPVSESGEIVLSRVVVPETIVVHDGAPSNSSAKNYYVPYREYIKNVASSEIYSTWPDATIRANVLAIMSFTLNRVYTEWYRNKGYDFTITSSTAYDQKWSYGRTIFENISQIVDEMYMNYLSRPNVRQPIFTQYCDGRNVSCPNWLSQWGSKNLGDDGYSAIEILRYYYGNDMFINTAEEISGIPTSWPGNNLQEGSTGPKVRQLQEQLNAIAKNYPAIPKVTVDGVFGPETRRAVSTFQSIFGLGSTGVVDYRTWFKISQIYVGVTKIAELV